MLPGVSPRHFTSSYVYAMKGGAIVMTPIKILAKPIST
jgi:hypothetical protein